MLILNLRLSLSALHNLIRHLASADLRLTCLKQIFLDSENSTDILVPATTGDAVKVSWQVFLSTKRNLIAQILCETQ